MTLQKILVIDDDRDLLTITRYCLEKLSGVVIQCVDSGEKALQVAPQFLPDLILLDVVMPNMNGITTFKALRSNSLFAAIPIIFLTASTRREDVEECLKTERVNIITKPFDPLEFASQVQAMYEKITSG